MTADPGSNEVSVARVICRIYPNLQAKSMRNDDQTITIIPKARSVINEHFKGHQNYVIMSAPYHNQINLKQTVGKLVEYNYKLTCTEVCLPLGGHSERSALIGARARVCVCKHSIRNLSQPLATYHS